MKNLPTHWPMAVAVLAGMMALIPQPASALDEIRAVWIQAWVNDLHSPQGIDQIIATARDANINTLIPQVRRRGDTLYFSAIEPRISQLANSDFDALQYMIDRAREQEPPMEVHAWIVAYPIGTSSHPDHTSNRNPEWLMMDQDGQTNAQHDPGHPGVHQHLLDVSMELITQYDIDGLHFDYIRYPEHPGDWGHNPVSIERFHRLYNRADIPSPHDEEWRQFRRDQITQTLRRIYLHAMAARPEIKISAATITWGHSGVGHIDEWWGSSAYAGVYQDWRGWMEEGILDLNIPMVYYREHNITPPQNHAQAYRNWATFAKDHKYNRQVVIGPGTYLNTLENAVTQMRVARETTPNGSTADGVAIYAYHATNTSHPNHLFYHALSNPSEHDAIQPPIFAEPAPIPDMPWKSNPTTGHLKGHVRDAATREPLDGARVRLTGDNEERVIQTDPHGFFGFVDLAPGDYLLTPQWNGIEGFSIETAVTAGGVHARDLEFSEPPPTTGALEGFVHNARTLQLVSGAIVRLQGEEVGEIETDGSGFYRFPTLPPGYYLVDALWDQAAAPAPAVMITVEIGATTLQDLNFAMPGSDGPVGEKIILDNEDKGVTFEGSDWRLATAAPGHHGNNYRFTHTPGHPEYAGLHLALYRPELPISGPYRIETWYPAGNNRANDVPYSVWDGSVERVVPINQQVNGGQWVTVSEALFLDASANPEVTISNEASPIVVMADAMRWTLLPEIEPAYLVTVDILGHGRVEGIPENGIAGHGTHLELTAVGENGFTFSHWQGNAWGHANPLPLAVGNDLLIGAHFISAYSRWIEENVENETSSAPGDDPGDHGIPNLLRFALGLDPESPAVSGLPRLERDGSSVRLVFQRRAGDTGLIFTMEESEDLATWVPVPEPLAKTSAPLNGSMEEITLEPPVSDTTRFYRLRVDLPVW